MRRTAVIEFKNTPLNFSLARFSKDDRFKILFGLFDVTRERREEMTKLNKWGVLFHRITGGDFWYYVKTRGGILEASHLWVEVKKASDWYQDFRMGRPHLPDSFANVVPNKFGEPLYTAVCEHCGKLFEGESDCCDDPDFKDTIVYKGFTIQ